MNKISALGLAVRIWAMTVIAGSLELLIPASVMHASWKINWYGNASPETVGLVQ